MHLTLTVCLLFQPIPGGKASKPQAAVQEVQGSTIEIPAIPASVQEARAGYAATRARILKELQDLETEIGACYQADEKNGSFNALSRNLVIAGSHRQESSAAITYIKDFKFLQLESAVQGQWNSWQSYLLTKAWFMDGTAAGRAIKFEAEMYPVNYVDYELAASNEKVRIYTTGSSLVLLDELTRTRSPFSGVLAIKALDYRSRAADAGQVLGMAGQQLRALEALWNPLRVHLENAASSFLRFEYENQGVRDQGIQALLKKAKIQILERCRYSLWFCLLAWAHFASQPLPALYPRFPGIY